LDGRLGNFWLFGGFGYDSTGLAADVLNDLWKYSGGEWTWMSGSNMINQPGSYGILGTPSPGNVPGARQYAVGWTDASGNLWLFGGANITTLGDTVFLNDLWEYGAGEWTWMGGSSGFNQFGSYGTLGIASPDNIPGARSGAVSWTDAAGNMWLFGGSSSPDEGVFELNDLWKYSANEWTWEGGSSSQDQAGTYGTLGTASANNTPGARTYAVGWSDASGNLWLFGGQGRDSIQGYGFLNDLWKFSAGDWTWIGGADLAGQTGTYGTLGIAAQSNVPPPRCCADSWSDASGNFWLLGGQSLNSSEYGGFNDLWKYSAAQWTWMGGSNTFNQSGTYGSLGITAPGNVPGERYSSATWTDASGNLWLFGGFASDSTGALGYLNDLWEYQP
jgi:hypothetical protein